MSGGNSLIYNFNPFNVPLYSKRYCRKHVVKKEISKLLIDQITSKVKWREIAENMVRDGVINFIEIGPGNVLTNLIKRISKNVNALSISKLEDLEKLDSIIL
jgi:(acyl-carrier-protein) S-malonyltransferase